MGRHGSAGTNLLRARPLLDPELPKLLASKNIASCHAETIWKYLLEHPTCTDVCEVVEALTSLPRKLQPLLVEQFTVSSSSIRKAIRSPDGTVKLLVALHDGSEIEAVVINHGGEGDFSNVDRARMRPGATLCVSSQVGCRMGCKFCATGTLGFQRHLEAAEILEQVRHAQTVRSDVHKVVFMGMGEPLENFAAVSVAARLLCSERFLFKLGSRPVTLSTVGGVPRSIVKLIDAQLAGITRLAVSLHAPTQELREQIVPSARAMPLNKLMDEIDLFWQAASTVSKRARDEGVLIEYCLMAGVNDSAECAHALGKLLQPRRDFVFVNAIPYNPVPGKPYRAPAWETTFNFVKVLGDYGVRGHARRQLGSTIASACGQLARTSPQLAAEVAACDIEDASGHSYATGLPEPERRGAWRIPSIATAAFAKAFPDVPMAKVTTMMVVTLLAGFAGLVATRRRQLCSR